MIAEGVVIALLATAYCPGECCCGKWANGLTSAGVRPAEGWTIACDQEVLPIGTIIDIEGLGERMCQDIGGAIKGRHIDLFMADHSRALEWGRQAVRARIVHLPERRALAAQAGPGQAGAGSGEPVAVEVGETAAEGRSWIGPARR